MNEHQIEIEIRIAYQEDTIQQLSQALIAQQLRIDQLEKWCVDLRERFLAMSDSDGAGKEIDQPPPHY